MRGKSDGFLFSPFKINMPVDFTQKSKLGLENLHLTESQLSRNKMWYLVDTHNTMCHISAKEFLNLNFSKVVLNKISIFSTKLTKFYIFTKL